MDLTHIMGKTETRAEVLHGANTPGGYLPMQRLVERIEFGPQGFRAKTLVALGRRKHRRRLGLRQGHGFFHQDMFTGI